MGVRSMSTSNDSVLFVDGGNPMVYEAVMYALLTEPTESRVKDDCSISEFEGARILIEYVKEAEGTIESKMRVSLACKYVAAMKGHGLEELLSEVYGDIVVKPAEGYQVAIEFNMDTVEGDKEAFAKKVASIKRYAVGAPLWKQFSILAGGGAKSAPMKVQNRPEDCYWIIPLPDKVIVAS